MSGTPELDDRSPSPEFELMLDSSPDEENNLGFSMLFAPDEKPNTTQRDEQMGGILAVDTHAAVEPNQPRAQEDIKAHRTSDDENVYQEQMDGIQAVDTDAFFEPNQLRAQEDIKANRTSDDENGSQAESASFSAPLKDNADSESSMPCSSPHSLDHGTSTFYPKFWHVTNKEKLLNILRKHKVLILSEIPPELMAEISQVSHVYVLQSSEEARLEDPDEWQHALGVFLSLMDQPMMDQWMFIFVDPSLDPQPRGADIEWSMLQHYQFGELVCENMVGLTKSGTPTAKTLISPQASEKAKKRGSALLPCPVAEKRRCCASGEILQWKCEKCNQELEYGFDGHFYCDCGKAPADSFMFHCGKPKHGREHVGFQDLDAALQQIKPFKEINILVLGETGVGKSTWINGFGNFLTYATLDEALQEPVYLIPAQFTTMDSNFNETVVSMGSSENEATQTGESATQMPKTYTFRKGNVLVRLIDTPGIGDTRGTEQDKKNFIHIMQHLAEYETLHGICILLKPNSARLTVMFQFCVKELLTHLHRDACHNIVFIFTNARATFYRPGDTFPTLKELIKNSKGVDIPLNKDTVYCVDSEAVRFMAALKAGVEFDQTERDNFVKSWEKSVEETTRLLQHVSNRTPHVLQNTLSLNEARRMILAFTEPLTHITKNIQTNVRLADDKADEIRAVKCGRETLRSKLAMPVLDLEMVQLNYPRTVCSSQSCIRLVGQKVNYVTWCHEHCYLKNIVPNQYPQPGLKGCEAMSGSGGQTCARCGCSWEKHMHITYELREVQINEVDQSIVDLLRHKDGEIAAVEQFMVELEQRKLDLLAEEEQIRKVSAKFGYFLKKNAMLPYNDAMEGYLRHLISAEEEKIAIGASLDGKRNYEKMLAAYREEKRILEEAMQNADEEHQITAKDIMQAMTSLFSLPMYGQTIRDMVDVVQNAQGQQMRHSEMFYAPKQSKKTIWKRNRMQSALELLSFGFVKGTRDDRDKSGQHRMGPLAGTGRGWNPERSIAYNQWEQYRGQYPPVSEYGDRQRQERMSGYGYGPIGHTSDRGNYGRAEGMSNSRMMGSQLGDQMFSSRMTGSQYEGQPYGRGYPQQPTGRSPPPPRDTNEGTSMRESFYQRFRQFWM